MIIYSKQKKKTKMFTSSEFALLMGLIIMFSTIYRTVGRGSVEGGSGK